MNKHPFIRMMAVALVMCLTADNVSSFSFLVSGSQSHITTRNQKLETCLPAGRTRNAFFRSQALSLSAANIPSASVIAKQAEIEAFLETIRKSQAQARHDRHALEMLTLHIIRKLDAWNDILPDATRDTLVQILVDLQVIWAERIYNRFLEGIVGGTENDGNWIPRQIWFEWDTEPPGWAMDFYRAWGATDPTRTAHFLINRRLSDISFQKLQRNFGEFIVELSRPNADRTAGFLVNARTLRPEQTGAWLEDLLLKIARTNSRNFGIVYNTLYTKRDLGWAADLLQILGKESPRLPRKPRTKLPQRLGHKNSGKRPLNEESGPIYTRGWLANMGGDPNEIANDLEADDSLDNAEESNLFMIPGLGDGVLNWTWKSGLSDRWAAGITAFLEATIFGGLLVGATSSWMHSNFEIAGMDFSFALLIGMFSIFSAFLFPLSHEGDLYYWEGGKLSQPTQTVEEREKALNRILLMGVVFRSAYMLTALVLIISGAGAVASMTTATVVEAAIHIAFNLRTSGPLAMASRSTKAQRQLWWLQEAAGRPTGSTELAKRGLLPGIARDILQHIGQNTLTQLKDLHSFLTGTRRDAEKILAQLALIVPQRESAPKITPIPAPKYIRQERPSGQGKVIPQVPEPANPQPRNLRGSAWQQHLLNSIAPITKPKLRTRIDASLMAHIPKNIPVLERGKNVDVIKEMFKDSRIPNVLKYLPVAPKINPLPPQPYYTPADIARNRQSMGLVRLNDETIMTMGQRGEIPITMKETKIGPNRRRYIRYQINPDVALWLVDLVSIEQAAILLDVNYPTILKQLKIPGQAKAWGLVIFWKKGEKWHPNEHWFVSLSRMLPLFHQRFHSIPFARAYRILRENGIAIVQHTLEDWCKAPDNMMGKVEALNLFGREGPLWDSARNIDIELFERLADHLSYNQRLLNTGWSIDELADRADIDRTALRHRVEAGFLEKDAIQTGKSRIIYRIPKYIGDRIVRLSKEMKITSSATRKERQIRTDRILAQAS